MSDFPDVIGRMLAVIAVIAAAGLLAPVMQAVWYGRYWAGWEAGRRSLHRDETGTTPAGYTPAVIPRKQRRQQ